MSYTDQQYEDFSKRMEATYPKIFAGQYGGFAVDKGWWPIIESLCGQIQSYTDWNNMNRETRPVVPQTVVMQVKEKFGGLRFYYDGGDEAVAGMVRMAEAWASHACEECGAPGTLGGKGWIKTLCPTHRAESDAKYEERFAE